MDVLMCERDAYTKHGVLRPLLQSKPMPMPMPMPTATSMPKVLRSSAVANPVVGKLVNSVVGMALTVLHAIY